MLRAHGVADCACVGVYIDANEIEIARAGGLEPIGTGVRGCGGGVVAPQYEPRPMTIIDARGTRS